MKLLVLMGGARRLEPPDAYPLFLTELDGGLVIEDVLANYMRGNFSEAVFCVRQSDIESFSMDSIIKSIAPEAAVVAVRGETAGAACTALLARRHIDTPEPLLVVSADDYISRDARELLARFSENGADVGLVSFDSVHPRYSFIKKDPDGAVCEVAEKRPVSRDALASFYYFKRGCDFVSAAEDEIRKDGMVNGAFYISGALNELILRQKKFDVVKIDGRDFHSFKTERQLAAYIASWKHAGDAI